MSDIFVMRRKGASFVEIGQRLGVTPTEAREILERVGTMKPTRPRPRSVSKTVVLRRAAARMRSAGFTAAEISAQLYGG